MKNVYLSKQRIKVANESHFDTVFIPTITDDALEDFENTTVVDENKNCRKSIIELSRTHPDLLSKLQKVNPFSTTTTDMTDDDLLATVVPRDNRNFLDLCKAAENLKNDLDESLTDAAQPKESESSDE